MSEIIKVDEFKQNVYRRKVRKKIEEVFKIYNNKKELLLDDIVSKMVSGGGYDTQPKAPGGYSNKLEKLVLDHASAEEYINLIDKIMLDLDELSYDILELVYIDRTSTNKEIYEEILDMEERQYYRDKWKAEVKFYRKLMVNYKKVENCQ